MSVRGYKYGLQRLYVCNVSSGINARFCDYCAHFTGIDTPTFKKMVKTNIKDDYIIIITP